LIIPWILFTFDDKGSLRVPVPGMGINGSIRLYSPFFWNTRLFLEGIMSLVLYSKEYPENGTMLNGGWHLGGGVAYSIGNNASLFVSARWFHTSNNDVYGRDRNPSINAVGLGLGISYK